MVGFKQFVNEGKYPIWVRVIVGSLVLKVRNLSNKIQNEDDPIEQNKLISQQNNLISYISGLGIGVGTSDTVLLRKMKRFK